MRDGFQVWGPCPLCEAWCIAVWWEDFPSREPGFNEVMRFGLDDLWDPDFTAWDVEDAVEDALYDHLEDEHGPYWRQDLTPVSDYDRDLVVAARRRRRVETVDLLARIPEP